MNKITRLKITKNSETCQEKTPKKPSLFNNKTQLEYNSDNLFYECMFAIHGGDSIQYDSNWNDAGAISLKHYIELIDDLIASNTHCQKRVLAFLITAKKTLNKVYFSIEFIAKALNMCYRTVSTAIKVLEEEGLISRVSGKVKHRTNLYFVKTILFIKEFRKVIKKLLKIISDFAPKAFIQQLPTILRNIILRIVNTYNKLIKEPENTIQHSSEIAGGRSPEVISPSCDAKRFFQRKKEKACASSRIISHQDSVPPGTVTSKECKEPVLRPSLRCVASEGKPEKDVISSHFMVKSNTNAHTDKKGIVMSGSNNSLKILADLEVEQMNKQRRIKRLGPQEMCPQELVDLKNSIAYHFGGYVHKKGDRIMNREYTTFLRKKYGL